MLELLGRIAEDLGELKERRNLRVREYVRQTRVYYT